jgi:hypothetical protein
MLLLKRHLVELVRAGRKRQTIRLWSRPLVRPGQITFAPGLGRLLITAVDQLPSLDALTDADARDDGFASKAALLEEIRRIYATPHAVSKPKRHPSRPQTPARAVYRVRFQWPLPDAAQTARTPASSKPARPKKRPGMSKAQRQKLHAYILIHKPRRA